MKTHVGNFSNQLSGDMAAFVHTANAQNRIPSAVAVPAQVFMNVRNANANLR
jgi:hypothetical protein